MVLNDAAMRIWCERWAHALQVQRIARDGRPYLDRYFVAGWNPFARRGDSAIFLHHFVASDEPGKFHTHPWDYSVSVILAGGYREQRCIAGAVMTRDYVAGDLNVLTADDQHRVEVLDADCWTLFLAGRFITRWRFVDGCLS